MFSRATGPIVALTASFLGEADDLLEGQKHNGHFLSHHFTCFCLLVFFGFFLNIAKSSVNETATLFQVGKLEFRHSGSIPLSCICFL